MTPAEIQMTPEMRDALQAVGQPLFFEDGAVLRQKGTYAPDLLLIASGQVDCVLSEGKALCVTTQPDTIVGEIGFLTGQAATATLCAIGPVEALSLDARALQRLQKNTPEVAAEVLRHIARLLRDRTAQNAGLLPTSPDSEASEIRVVRCSTLDQKRTAQRIRYDVHCLEQDLPTDGADHDEGIISDDLDRTGTSFIAYVGAQTIGAMRVNFSAEGTRTGVITDIALRETHASEDLYRQFVQAIATYCKAAEAKALVAPCTPLQAATFAALGFHTAPQDAPSPGRVLMELRPLPQN